jgi:hypothetical protein
MSDMLLTEMLDVGGNFLKGFLEGLERSGGEKSTRGKQAWS